MGRHRIYRPPKDRKNHLLGSQMKWKRYPHGLFIVLLIQERRCFTLLVWLCPTTYNYVCPFAKYTQGKT